MLRINKTFLMLCFICLQTVSCTSTGINTAKLNKSGQRPIVFENVNVVPMDSERILNAQTVIIQSGRIQNIGLHQEVIIPEDAIRIDGSGKYLMPALADMHVHINNPNDLLLFIAHGVTTVQNMWGYDRLRLRIMGLPGQLKLREKINQGIQLNRRRI